MRDEAVQVLDMVHPTYGYGTEWRGRPLPGGGQQQCKQGTSIKERDAAAERFREEQRAWKAKEELAAQTAQMFKKAKHV